MENNFIPLIPASTSLRPLRQRTASSNSNRSNSNSTSRRGSFCSSKETKTTTTTSKNNFSTAMVSSGSRSIQVQRRNNSKTGKEKSSGCAGNSTASNRNQLRKSYEASSTVPKLKTTSVSERGSKLKPATRSLLKPSTPNYGRRTKTSPSFKKPLDSPLLTPLPPSPCSTPRLTPRSRRASNTSQVSKKSEISVISKNTDISTKKSEISIESLKLKSRRKTTLLTSTRSKSIKMASNSSKDDGFGSFDTLRTSPGNRPITPQTPGKAKFSAKPRALDITKQISQTTSRVKFYKTGDCFSSALNIMVSAERYDSIDRLCSELTKSFDKQLMRGANSLPRGVRAIFQFDVLQIRAYDSETMENDKHDDNIQNLKIENINLNSSITSNSSKNSHTNSQTNSSKQGDSMLLTKIENLSQFKSNQTYLCTSSTAITSLDRKTVRQIAKNQGKPKNFNNQKTAQNLKFSSKTSSKTSSNKSNPRPTPTSVQQNSFFTRDIDINRDIIKPRHVFLLKPGRRPRTIKKFLLNTRTVHSFSQLLDDFSTTISLESGAVYHVYDQLTGEKVEKLEQFFGESRVFLVYGNRKSSAYNASDGTLDLTESGSIERQMGGGGGGRGRSQVTKSTNLVKRTNSVGKFGENQLKVKNSDAVQKSKNYGRSRSVKSRGNGLKLKSKTRVKAKPARNSIFDDLPFELVKNLQIIRNIGVGNFAEVSIVRRISDNRELALKAIDKTKRLSNEHDIKAEAEILMSIKNKEHANIVYMHEFWEFEDRIFLLLDYINGGDLFDMISRRKRFSERETVHMLKDLLRALRFLHSFNICHRDVKPENCLLYFSPNDVENGDILKSCLKITDFGLACQMKSTEDRLTMICGSPTYVAPEIIAQDGLGYSLQVDLWAVGVISYILLVGMPPFQSNDGSQEALFDAILNGSYEIPIDVSISKTAAHFMSQLIKLEDVLRLSSEDALKHPWLAGSRNAGKVVVHGSDENGHVENGNDTDFLESSVGTTVQDTNLIDFGENMNQVASLPNSSELTLSNLSSEGVEPEVPISNGFQSTHDDDDLLF